MSETPTLRFLGAAGTVTGSKHLIETGTEQVLLDCGLFQGLKELRLRNRDSFPFDATGLAAVILSHAHIDHSGALPLLVKNGFSGPIHCTAGTRDLLRALLLDAAHLQEEEAEYANRHGYSKHRPALPLYTAADAEAALRLLESHPYGQPFRAAQLATATFHRAGHILGSAVVDLALGGPATTRIAFSGDLGRWNRPILRDPELIPEADVLLVESTYGDRVHGLDPTSELARLITSTAEKGGVIVAPSFAVGRTQELIWAIRKLEDADRIPVLPVYVDSPMALDVTEIYCRHPEDHDLDMKLLMDEERCPLCCRKYNLVRRASDSKALNRRRGPMVIISASGMASGGRVLHHLKERLPDARNTVLLPGFQAAGTRGRRLQDGAKSVRIHGQEVAVQASVVTVDGFSAHADRDEILRWLAGFRRPPRQTYVVHGEAPAAEALANTLRTRLGWRTEVARDGQTVSLKA